MNIDEKYEYVIGITPSLANITFNKILSGFQDSGYDIVKVGEPEKISGKNMLTNFIQKYRIASCWNDSRTNKYILTKNAPLFEVSLTAYEDELYNGNITYNLGAKIKGNINIYDWEGEDSSLALLRNVFIEDAIYGVINAYADYDYIAEVVNENVNRRLARKAVNRIYENLCKQIKEDTDNGEENISIDDLNEKIDIIMDALGLKEDEDNETEKIDISLSDNKDIEEDSTTIEDSTDDIKFTDIEIDTEEGEEE